MQIVNVGTILNVLGQLRPVSLLNDSIFEVFLEFANVYLTRHAQNLQIPV